MKVAFIADSTGSLSTELLNDLDVYQVNLTVNFDDGEEFTDTNNQENIKRFYDRMEATQSIPSTSQPEPAQFIAVLDEIIEKNYDHVIFIHLSSKLSGTMQTAQLVAKDYDDRIQSHFIDSKGTSFVIENLLIQGQRLLEEGQSIEEVTEKLQWVADRSFIYVMIENLSHLEKGGRVSKGSAKIGKLLNVKPILVMNEEGLVEVYDKVRSTKRVYKEWKDLVKEAYEKYDGKISLAFAHADDEDETLKIQNQIQKLYPDLDYRIGYLTPILGTHGGKGAKGMGIIPIVD